MERGEGRSHLQQLNVGDLTIELILLFIPTVVHNTQNEIKFGNIRNLLHISDDCRIFTIDGSLDRGLDQVYFNTNVSPAKQIRNQNLAQEIPLTVRDIGP